MSVEARSNDAPNGENHKCSSRLMVCFDGTGNAFTGTPGDTNIVKLYNMFDRGSNDQMHYYQPGIGTYPAEGPVNVNLIRTFVRNIEAIIDQALATSFDTHVIAGYNFIMRNYKPGDRIYIFGFSRGAFTARFVARMISHVGLLSRGNEEMVPFAYKVYQEYEANRDGIGPEQTARVKYMNSFKKHFCRTEREEALRNDEDISENESGIKVHFLGLFDCVSSVGNLDIPFFQKTPPLPAVTGTAKHIRHAVAIDERRVKFKAALFQQEVPPPNEDIKEVWFPGNHGDVGGGWNVPAKENGEARENSDDDYFQLSDISLKWMIDEIDHLELQFEEEDRVAWDKKEKAGFLTRYEKHKTVMIETAQMHDTMAFGGGSSWMTTLMWKWMDTIPFIIKRWEFVRKSGTKNGWHWDYIGFPANHGSRRDIPSRALMHHSVLLRLRNGKNVGNKNYLPSNLLWVAKEPDTEELERRNFKELGALYSSKAENSKTNGVLTTVAGLTFIHDTQQTIGSVSVKGLQDNLSRPLKSDRVYRIQKLIGS